MPPFASILHLFAPLRAGEGAPTPHRIVFVPSLAYFVVLVMSWVTLFLVMSCPIFSPTHAFVSPNAPPQKPSHRCLFVFPTLEIGCVVLTCLPSSPSHGGVGRDAMYMYLSLRRVTRVRLRQKKWLTTTPADVSQSNFLCRLFPRPPQVNPASMPEGPQASAMVGEMKLVIPIPEELQAKEKARLQKEKDKLTADIETMQKRLSNKGFVDKAPEQVVAKARAELADLELKLTEVEAKLQ